MNLPSALALSRYPTFIIGGAQSLHKDALENTEIDTIYATEVDAAFSDTDVFFPDIDMTIWEETDPCPSPSARRGQCLYF
ncbi:dihydrofolate reductase [Candidatus Minimicrobia naudis]|uniref:Dihydrofolate reductase n=1 Tax=Candidatus Minimicrobia naudis TaxID=2841263 RepID=A0A8F1MB97_9BACT|nr:dihydrofolate reductase [Candidatus Minimicrobia naudis]